MLQGFGFIMADIFFGFCVETHYITVPSMMILDILVPAGDGQRTEDLCVFVFYTTMYVQY